MTAMNETAKHNQLQAFMERLAVDPNAKAPEGIHVHVTKTPEPCDHEWNNGCVNPEYCLKCGISLWAHAFMECP
jgi:hypothetical protein